MENKCFIEPLIGGSKQSCSLCNQERIFGFRMSIHLQTQLSKSAKEDWREMCSFCRNRIVAVADLYTFVRNLRAGIYKGTIIDMYKMLMRLRIRINIARISSS